MQAANQFTPDQLIVAGRRAESQGQPAYALQFYRYVADQFPTSTEAYEARDALFRLTPAAPETGPPRAPAAQIATGYAGPPPVRLEDNNQQHLIPSATSVQPRTPSKPRSACGLTRTHAVPTRPEPRSPTPLMRRR